MNLNYNDWVQGDKFKSLNNDKIIFCRTEDVNSFFKICDKTKPFILITHNGDGSITDNPRSVNTMEAHHHADVNLMPSNLHKWYGCMVEYDNEKIISLPLGVENDQHFEYKKSIILNEINSPVEKYEDKLLFVNFKISNNYSERIKAYNAIKDFNFCTFTDIMFTDEQLNIPKEKFPYINNLPFNIFAKEIRKHHFTICPVGNGLDSHRLWESLYLGSIPIVKRNLNYSFYENKLPILYINEWKEITKELLLEKKIEIKNKINNGYYNFKLLNFSYWENLIKEESKKI